MSPSGRPRKPRALKALDGTLRPDRDKPEPDYPLTEGAEPPYWLDDGPAFEEWQRMLPLLEGNGVLSEADVSAFAHYCNLHGKIVRKWTSGETPSATLLARLAAMQGRFGLTPADRGNVSSLGKSKADDPWSEMAS